MERPALNPTTNVTSNKPPPLGGLSYEKDSSRPGGGVFIAHGDVKGAYPEAAPGVIIESDEDDEGEVMSCCPRRTGLHGPQMVQHRQRWRNKIALKLSRPQHRMRK